MCLSCVEEGDRCDRFEGFVRLPHPQGLLSDHTDESRQQGSVSTNRILGAKVGLAPIGKRSPEESSDRAREMAQRLRELAALPEDKGSIPSPPMMVHNHL